MQTTFLIHIRPRAKCVVWWLVCLGFMNFDCRWSPKIVVLGDWKCRLYSSRTQGSIKLPSFPISKMSLRRHCFEVDERKSSLSRRIGATKGKMNVRAPKKWPLEGQSRAAHHDYRNHRGSLSAEQVPGDQNTLCLPPNVWSKEGICVVLRQMSAAGSVQSPVLVPSTVLVHWY